MRPDLLFSDYHYASGTSRSLKRYFDRYAAELAERFGADARVLEVACNDGSFLDSLQARGMRNLKGVDPARNIVELARARGLDVDAAFFDPSYARGHTPRYDLVIGQNVLAHTPDPLGLLQAAAAMLAQGGEIHIQTSQANMLFNGEFDTVYHEHYSFFGAHSMRELARRAGLVLVHIDYPEVHGTSFRFVLRRHGPTRASVQERLSFERDNGLLDGRCFSAFAALAQDRVQAYRLHMRRWRADGRTIVGVGVAAKAVTFFHYAGVFPDRVADEAVLKIGLCLPGSTLRVQSLDSLSGLPRGTVFVIGAWNFFAELRGKVADVRAEQGAEDLYVRYLPEVEVHGHSSAK